MSSAAGINIDAEIGYIMRKICKNCEHFVPKGFSRSSLRWGDCMKPREDVEGNLNKERGVFVWDDKTCNDFKPKKGWSENLH
jgi:hypothetical protein